MRRLLLLLIAGYRRWISPIKPPSCRYLPTCSAFAAEALERHGCWRGSWLALRRILSCHPWGGHGLDPVPERCTCIGGRMEIGSSTPDGHHDTGTQCRHGPTSSSTPNSASPPPESN